MGNHTGNKKIKIAFDLDGVIIDKPPLIPKSLLEKLFRGCKNNRKLYYRFPKSKFEIFIRKLSHYYLFRPPIKENIDFVKKLAKNEKYQLYIISGRYSFLRLETNNWLEKRGLKGIFEEVFLNDDNEQPHLFKEKMLGKLKINIFVDDDDILVDYLVSKNLETKFFCFSKSLVNSSKVKVIESLKNLI